MLVATDDDVRPDPDWLEELLRPFARADVGAATGNVLPAELDARSQRLFEQYGGLGRGFEPRVFDAAWFERHRTAAPTWLIGATANAAFRASALRDPRVGLMDEALGPGMPSGVGEDTYLFYRLLKAGWAIAYTPDAAVWHRHRDTVGGLRRQLYDYSKGHTAYHLTTLLRDGDLRAAVYLARNLPRSHLWRIAQRLRGRTDYPLGLNLLEIRGNLAGPLALWRSRRRVAREGGSGRPRGPRRPYAAPEAPARRLHRRGGWSRPSPLGPRTSSGRARHR